MKNNLKKPCDECPFRKDSLPGWLGGETPSETFDHVVEHEGDFACHMTRHKKEQEMSRCRGSLMFLRKMGKMPRYNAPLAQDLAKIDFKTAFNDQTILTRIEFMEHHNSKFNKFTTKNSKKKKK